MSISGPAGRLSLRPVWYDTPDERRSRKSGATVEESRSSGVTLEAVLARVAEIRYGRYVFAHSHFEVGEGFAEIGRRIGQRAR